VSTGDAANLAEGVELVRADVADAEAVERAFAGRSFDAVFHVAGQERRVARVQILN
jgi:nucleoside-diphosphate-sugar epimerase